MSETESDFVFDALYDEFYNFHENRQYGADYILSGSGGIFCSLAGALWCHLSKVIKIVSK
jgi:hypothetical protein